jgi:hypothetical protein
MAASVLGELRKMFGPIEPMLAEGLLAGGKINWRLEGHDNFPLDIFLGRRGFRQPPATSKAAASANIRGFLKKTFEIRDATVRARKIERDKKGRTIIVTLNQKAAALAIRFNRQRWKSGPGNSEGTGQATGGF